MTIPTISILSILMQNNDINTNNNNNNTVNTNNDNNNTVNTVNDYNYNNMRTTTSITSA